MLFKKNISNFSCFIIQYSDPGCGISCQSHLKEKYCETKLHVFNTVETLEGGDRLSKIWIDFFFPIIALKIRPQSVQMLIE